MKGMHRLYRPVGGRGMGLPLRTGRHVAYRRRLQAGNPGRSSVLALAAYMAAVPGVLAYAARDVAVQPPEVSRGVAPNAVFTYSARP